MRRRRPRDAALAGQPSRDARLSQCARLAAFAVLALAFSWSNRRRRPRRQRNCPPGRHAPARCARRRHFLYQHTPKLENPKNDAADVSAVLKALGFQVLDGFDLDKAAFDRKVRDFAVALQGAEVGLFFYAGHGLQMAGQNYLVPVDAELKTASALDFEMVRLEVVQRDGARDKHQHPFPRCLPRQPSRAEPRSSGWYAFAEIGRGFAPVVSGVGTLISFSTQPSNVALDGTGRNSPFSGALVGTWLHRTMT